MAASVDHVAQVIDVVYAKLIQLGLHGTAELWRDEPDTRLQVTEILARESVRRDGPEVAEKWRTLGLSVLPSPLRAWALIIEMVRAADPVAARDMQTWLSRPRSRP